MTKVERGPSPLRRAAMTNMGAQLAALLALSVASLLVARTTSTAVVGEYALLRVLPWLLAVACSAGLPVSSAYFLASPQQTPARLRPTIGAIAVAGAGAGCGVWLIAARAVRHVYFPDLKPGVLAVAAFLVVTQLLTVTAKACCQGTGDIAGANLVIVAEELAFLPWYGLVMAFGHAGATGVVVAMLAGGASAALVGVIRLASRHFFTRWGLPSVSVGRRIASYGARGQLGNVLWLLNLRLDFLILGALAGPAALGIYAVASKIAELMRLGPTAVNYVLYPRFSGMPALEAVREARSLFPRTTLLIASAAPAVALAAIFGIPLIYGPSFGPAVVPACLIVVGLVPEGAAAIASALLWGLGRPGLNSAAMAAGLAATVVLDVVLIPRHGAVGAAAASAAAYILTTFMLVVSAARTGTRVSAACRAECASVTPAGPELSASGPAI